MRLNPGQLLKTFLLNHQDAVTGTRVRAVSEQAEQVPAQSGLFAFQIRILRGAAIGKSSKTCVLPI